MRAIFEVFRTDVKRICNNFMALLVAAGMIILPGIYAWINIDSNWDPYENTSEMPIAVANEDEVAKGRRAMIPIIMSKEIPLPTPLSVIRSPSHITNKVPQIKIMILETQKKALGALPSKG